MSDQDKSTKEPKITDAIKKIFTAGVSGALLSEDVLRSYLSDLKLPKELMQILLQSAQKSKEEVTSKISREVTHMLSKIDWVEAGSKFLEGHKVSIKMDLEFTKKPLAKEALSVTNNTRSKKS